jgi:haloacid dehalogenase superfamily, subfamily IA, variant 3 with third motif having DD or ED
MKGIIFDFNGTLFWDSEIQENAWKTFGTKLSGRNITDEEFNTYFHGRTNKDTLEYLTERVLTDKEVNELAQQKESIYRDLCKSDLNKFKLAPGVERYLDYLKENNIPFTIATASEINNVNFFIKEFQLDKWFDIIKIVYDDGTFRGKPEPDIYLKASEALNIQPDNCIVFEDALSGVQSAQRAGVKEIIAVVPEGRKNIFENQPNLKIISAFDDIRLYDVEKYK